MKITILLFVLGITNIFAVNSYSQTAKVSLNLKNVTVEQVLNEIESKTDFYFLFNQKLVDVTRKVDISANKSMIKDVLSQVFSGADVDYVVYDRQIVLTTKSKAITIKAELQQVMVTGTVNDAKSGAGLPGVNIKIQGTSDGTITDLDGNFTLKVPSSTSTLSFSFIGYIPQIIALDGKTKVDVLMVEEVRGLDEVIVVGYGTQKKSDISGSVATVKTDKLVSQPTSDLQGMLKGKVPGLYVTLSDARPGGSSDVLLRGIKSLKGGNSPLYVVDGVPISSINEININDVESLSVLKDASSQSIYGARASNGVILITTKRGSSKNKVNVSYSTFYSIQNVDPNFEIFSPEEYVQLRREAYRGDLANATNNWLGSYPDDAQMFTPEEITSIANKEYVNWTDYAFKKDVPMAKHDISVSGGNENTQFSASLGYLNQDGIRSGSDLKRYSGKLTLDQKISNTFKLGLSAYYTNYTKGEETNSWQDFLTFTPISKIYDSNGELVLYPTGDGKSVNPLYYDKTRKYDYKAERIILNGYFEITPTYIPGLKYKLNASLNSRHRETDYFRSFDDPGVIGKGYASANFYDTREYLLENIITYSKDFSEKHKLNITLMQGIEPRNNTSTTSTALQLGNDFFGINSLNSFIESEVERGRDERKMVSYMGRINYNLMDRYLVNFAVRADGSSVFGTNNKWGYFPSASIAWNLHKESFMESLSWLEEFKIRLSYGQIGNQAISPYESLATADDNFYVSLGIPQVGYLPGSSLPNPNLRWETTTTINGGVDFSIFKGRITGSVDYYKSNTVDLLVDRKVPTVLGYSNIPTNLGEIQNTGIEFTTTGYIISKKDFRWSVSANFSANKNKLIKGVLQDPETGAYIDDLSNEWFIGQPVNVYFDHKFDGIWQLTDNITGSAQPNARPGDIKVVDVNGDGTINSDDRVIIKRDPKWMGSFSTSFEYKGFEFSADMYFVRGVIRQNPFMQDFNYGGRIDGVKNGIKRDYWTPENPSNTMFRPHAVNFTDYRESISYKDASYSRLRNVQLSYTLPNNWLTPLKISKLRVYLSGENLWTKSEFLSYSPETLAGSYPETKKYTIGININF